MTMCHREPTLADTLADPLIAAMMAADGVDARKLEVALRGVARNLERHSQDAWTIGAIKSRWVKQRSLAHRD
jgi:hypothetical protein